MSPAQLLADLVRIPALSGEEDLVASWLCDYLSGLGLNVHRKFNNLWFTVGTAGPRLLFCSHLDTVPAGTGWSVDPHAAQWSNGKLVGLGANDAKGCGVAMIFAALAHHRDGQVTVALTGEEENGGHKGILSVIEDLQADGAIVGEPTSLRACTEQGGLLLMEGVAKGTPAHAAHGKDNPIFMAARDLVKLGEMSFAPHPRMGAASPQVTVIRAGDKHNQIPGECLFTIDMRTTPNLDHDQVLSEIQEQLESEITAKSLRYRPMQTPEIHPIYRAALTSSPVAEPVSSMTVSDWPFLGDIPAVKMGPGDTKRSHTVDEYLLESELMEGIEVYKKMTSAFFHEVAHG